MAKRAKLEIIRDILRIVKNNKNAIRPTPLLRKSNLSSARFKEYFNDLEKRNMVMEVYQKGIKLISVTTKGEKFLEKYSTIIDFIDEFEL